MATLLQNVPDRLDRRLAQALIWDESSDIVIQENPKSAGSKFVIQFPLHTPPNFSRPGNARVQTSNISCTMAVPSLPSKNPCRADHVRRWDAQTRTYSNWNSLRRDDELWNDLGDCPVHLYSKGNSMRGPSFKVSLKSLHTAKCDLLAEAASDIDHEICLSGFSSARDSGYATVSTEAVRHELFIAAPEDMSRDETFSWHLTTRNFFAWLTDKPLVGVNLGSALIQLLERMQMYRSLYVNNVKDLLDYAQRLGYLDFSHCPDYALAFLRFAEQFELRDLWTDAFAHCVGMNESLYLSPEVGGISKVSKALITRAHLEMDLHLGRVSRALYTILEDELAAANFGLPASAQLHLDRFRSFIYSFYISKYGCWPPDNEGFVFSKELLQSMYSEFRNLHDLLADTRSSDHVANASGGICVLQNVAAFDQRHGYEPLHSRLPLLPEIPERPRKRDSQRGLRAFKLGSKSSKADEDAIIARRALAMAINSAKFTDCSLVNEYLCYEQEWTANPEEKLSIIDARKVRWIVIYAFLQMLTSVIRVPPEVRNAESASYHMCVLTAGTPPWTTRAHANEEHTNAISGESFARQINTYMAGLALEGSRASPVLSIHPDCETDGEFIGGTTIVEASGSVASLRPSPLRINTAIPSRTSSVRSIRGRIMSSLPFSSLRSATSPTSSSAHPPVGHEQAVPPSPPCISIIDDASPHPEVEEPDWSEVDDLRKSTRSPILDVQMFDAPIRTPPSRPPRPSYTPSLISSFSTHTSSTASSSCASEDLDAFTWSNSTSTSSSNSGDESHSHSHGHSSHRRRRASTRIYSMEHESVYSRTSLLNLSSNPNLAKRKSTSTLTSLSSSLTRSPSTSTATASASPIELSTPLCNKLPVLPEAARTRSNSDVSAASNRSPHTERPGSEGVDAMALMQAQQMNLPMWWGDDVGAGAGASAALAMGHPAFRDTAKAGVWQGGEGSVEEVKEEEEEEEGKGKGKVEEEEKDEEEESAGAQEAQIDIHQALNMLPVSVSALA